MDNKFNCTEYSDALDNFINTAEELPPVIDHPEFNKACIQVCRLMNIAKLEMLLYELWENTDSINVKQFVFFCSEDHDENRPEKIEKHSHSGDKAEYFIYPYKNSVPWSDEENKRIHSFINLLFIINERANLICTTERLKFYDNDLGIPNMSCFMRNVSMLLKKSKMADYACCRFNMKNFTLVNKQLGRENGTAVMYRYVNDLQRAIGDEGTIFRIGGDNFLMYFKKRMLNCVQNYHQGTEVKTGNNNEPEIRLSAHAGYYIVDENCKSVEEIMDKLTVALTMARENHTAPYVVFDENMQKKQLEKKWVDNVFQYAIDNEEFMVYYQPKVNLKTYTIDGAEALCRWKHNGEIIAPYKFIPQLEQSNNICTLDFYMLEHVCRDMRRWLDEGRELVRISVNLSRVNLGSSMLFERIMEIIDKYEIPHNYIEIEITETTTDVDYNELKKLVCQLHNEGIHTSIDDFGTGFSSLNLIYDLPWNIIKIDKSFLPDDENSVDKQKQIILKHIINMAQNLGIECIVEGVETKEQIALLKDNNCYRAQGFHFDKPLPVEEFEKRLVNK